MAQRIWETKELLYLVAADRRLFAVEQRLTVGDNMRNTVIVKSHYDDLTAVVLVSKPLGG